MSIKLIPGKLYINKSNIAPVVFVRQNDGYYIGTTTIIKTYDVLFYIEKIKCLETQHLFSKFIFENKVIYILYTSCLQELVI